MNRTTLTLLAMVACEACSRTPARTARPDATPPVTVSPAVTIPPEVATPSAAIVTAPDLMAVAPELTAASAELLIERFGAQYASAEAIAEAGIATASSGFRTLDPKEAAEAGALLDAAYGTLGSGGRAKIGVYLDQVRSGAVTPGESAAGRQLFTDALGRLPARRRVRLASLYETAIVAGLKEYAAAQTRTRDAQPIGGVAVAPAAPSAALVTTATSVGSTRSGSIHPSMAGLLPKTGGLPTRGEAYWKAEAQRRQQRVTTLEQELAKLQAQYDAWSKSGPDRSGTLMAADRTAWAENTRRRIAELKGLAEQARVSVLDLEYDCVRDNGLPGWVR